MNIDDLGPTGFDNPEPPPEDNWPLSSFDARDWAEEFCRIAKEKGFDLDKEWMVTWFANALMRGYDEGKKEKP